MLFYISGEEFRSFNNSDTIGIQQLQNRGVAVKIIAGKLFYDTPLCNH